MLNEERIKLMVKLASYEAKEGKEDFKISSYYKKDYVSINRWYTMIWVTFAYALMILLVGLAYLEQILDHLTLKSLIMMTGGLLAGYVLILIVYGIVASKIYKRKHSEARQHVKRYSHNLLVLNKVYEKENM